MLSPIRSRTVLAIVVAIIALAFTSCSDSDSDTNRSSASADCPARYGCASFAAEFKVINETNAAITLQAKEIVNVKGSDRSILNLTIPAQSASPKLAVILGDDGFQNGKGGYVRGRSEGAWTWTISTDSSTTEARIELAASKDDSMGMVLYEGRAHIGQPLATWNSAYDPVTLNSTTGVASFTAIGSRPIDFEQTMPTSSWTFSPPPS
jgi:hypothetical protein